MTLKAPGCSWGKVILAILKAIGLATFSPKRWFSGHHPHAATSLCSGLMCGVSVATCMKTNPLTTRPSGPWRTLRSCTRPRTSNLLSRRLSLLFLKSHLSSKSLQIRAILGFSIISERSSPGNIRPTSSRTSRAAVSRSLSPTSWRPPGSPTWPPQRSFSLMALRMKNASRSSTFTLLKMASTSFARLWVTSGLEMASMSAVTSGFWRNAAGERRSRSATHALLRPGITVALPSAA
mmetsp:Transcript_2127/g.4881  ORF Transcript_2127/g.4881 Transcript_2127/m.4881 type:complete len:236 (+) Transcript_2127:517-1224(+)